VSVETLVLADSAALLNSMLCLLLWGFSPCGRLKTSPAATNTEDKNVSD
jgi:hypothetical protein